MRNSRSRIAFLSTLTLIAVVALLFARPGESQNAQKRNSDGSVKPVLKSMSVVPAANGATSPVAAAAVRNQLLRSDSNWTFGGKQQKGWYLYTSLINQLIGTNKDAGSEDFAEALARWQSKSGLTPSGVLDQETLYAMVSVWQGRRLKERGFATPDQLITVPASNFYDPTRADELRKVERATYAACERMISAAIADRSLGLAVGPDGKLAPSEKFLKIMSAFRSREYQEHLRKQSPNAGRAGLAINSPHFTGRALDLYVGGDPVDTSDSNRAIQVQTKVYQWLVRNAEKFGFRPYYYEPWHWEYVSTRPE